MKSTGVIIILLVILAIMTGGSGYFYSQSKSDSKRLKDLSNELEKLKSEQKESPVESAREAGEPVKEVEIVPQVESKEEEKQGPLLSKNRASNPRLTHKVEPGETLFTISTKYELLWTEVALANGLEDENALKAGDILIVPEIDKFNKTNQISFILNSESLEKFQKNSQFTESWRLDPIEMVKNETAPAYGLNKESDYQLKTKDDKNGTTIISALKNEHEYEITLTQPLEKGEGKIWAIKNIKKLK